MGTTTANSNREYLSRLYASNSAPQFMAFSSSPHSFPRPVPLSSVVNIEHIQVEVSVDRNSIQLVPIEGQDKKYNLEFTFTAIVDCRVTIYQFAQEILDEHRVTKRIDVDRVLYPAPHSFQIPAGEKQLFKQASLELELELWPEDLLVTADRSIFPLVIEIKPDIPNSAAEATYCCYNQHSAAAYSLKVLCQKLTVNGRTYELYEIFGTQAGEEERSDCVVCMSEKRNTTVMPCRHMCLCRVCADVMRSHTTSKCPICRVPVESLIEVKL